LISPLHGAVSFGRGLRIEAHAQIATLLVPVLRSGYPSVTREIPIPGWRQYLLGVHRSEHGEFEVEAAVSEEDRVEALFLSHRHSFYQADTPGDAERRVYHEGVISSDLRGQKEFSWGHVFCHFNARLRRDWLVIVYNPFLNVPLDPRAVKMLLAAHEPFPSDED
jgi:hypothetical protein